MVNAAADFVEHRERWLVTGASGQLGSYLVPRLRRRSVDLHCTAASGTSLGPDEVAAADLTDPREVARLLREVRPHRIFHLAALARTSAAESRPDVAMALHRDATRLMAAHAAATGGWMLYCSTDYVFCGERDGLRAEDDPTRPATVYGRSKLMGEGEVLSRRAGLVVRLPMLFGRSISPKARSWDEVFRSFEADLPVSAVDDETRTPLAFEEAARLLATLSGDSRRGLVHVAGADVLTPYALMTLLRDRSGSRSQIVPVSRKDFAAQIDRPRNAALDTSRLRAWMGQIARRPAAVRAQAG